MKKFKKILRIVFLIILILMACLGAGFILPTQRGRFMDNEIRIELVEDKHNEEEGDLKEKT